MRTRLVGASLSVLLMAGVAGCGGTSLADLSTQKIRDRVQEDMKTVTSLTLDGQVTQQGSTVALEVAMNDEGDCKGTITIKGAQAHLRVVDGEQYFRGGEEFWSTMAGPMAGAITKKLGGKWAKLPGGGLGGFCQLDDLLGEITEEDDSGSDPRITKGEVTEINGKQALELSRKEDGGTTRVWVATGDENYILKVARKGEESGQFLLRDYNEPVEVTAPPEGEYVDLSQLAS